MFGVIHADSLGLQNFTRRYFQTVIFNPNIFAKNIQAVESFVHAKMPANSARPLILWQGETLPLSSIMPLIKTADG